MAGALKRGAPDMPEQLVLMRALRDMNLPKFVFDDVPLFLGLIGDLFPGGWGGVVVLAQTWSFDRAGAGGGGLTESCMRHGWLPRPKGRRPGSWIAS